jgi:hypothetical protein
MKRIGDDSAGFSAEFDPSTSEVRVRGWGFWDTATAGAFADTVLAVCAASPRRASVCMDLTELKPLRDEGQRSFGALIGTFARIGVVSASVTTASHLTKLQLMRLVAERGMKDSVRFLTNEANGPPASPRGEPNKENGSK